MYPGTYSKKDGNVHIAHTQIITHVHPIMNFVTGLVTCKNFRRSVII